MELSEFIIQRSQEIPLVIDFWAPWCGPCQVLGPIIEALDKESNGKWELLKINSDDHQELAGQYKVKGIPSVKMVFKGKVIAEFTGAKPKHEIQNWLKENLPDDRINTWNELVAHDNLDEAQKFIEDNPDLPEQKFWLALKLIFLDPEKVTAWLNDLKFDPTFGFKSQQLTAILALIATDMEQLEKSNAGLKLSETRIAMLQGNFEQAIQSAIESIVADKNLLDELARRVCLGLFEYLGNEDPLVVKYRRRFNMALY